MDEKKEFAERLRAAMIDAGHEARPSVLEANFNSRYWGRSVSYQAARRWLIGLSLPEQDKLQVLAEWLGVEPQVLRFGQKAAQGGRELAGAVASSLNNHDRAAVEAFLALPATHRKLAREMIAGLAQLSQQARS